MCGREWERQAGGRSGKARPHGEGQGQAGEGRWQQGAGYKGSTKVKGKMEGGNKEGTTPHCPPPVQSPPPERGRVGGWWGWWGSTGMGNALGQG